MTPTKQHEILYDLAKLLRSICHAPGCKTVSRCPHLCSCRSERTFKTNTETAICWQLSHLIFNYLRGDRKIAKDKIKLETCARVYFYLSDYHMTKGWTNLYKKSLVIIQMVLYPSEYYNPENRISRLFMDMRRVINRLKREPIG